MAEETKIEWLKTKGGQKIPFAVPKNISDPQKMIDYMEAKFAPAIIAADRVGSDVDPGDEEPGNWERWINQLADAVLFGGGDEATGGANVLPGYVSRLVDGDIEMPKTLDQMRQQISDIYTVEKAKARASRSNETSADLAAIPVGMVVPGANVAKIGQFMTSAPKWIKAGVDMAANGALWGAVSGGLSTEGDLGDRAVGAVKGAEFGAEAGPILGAGAKAVVVGAKAVGRAIRSGAAALGYKPREEALRRVRQALDDDGVPIGRVVDDLVEGGVKPATLADVAGDNIRRLVRQAAGLPGKASQQAKEVFLGRQSRKASADPARETYQSGRIVSDLRQGIMEGDLMRFGKAHEALQVKRSADAGPYYERAWKMPTPYTEELEALLNRPTVKSSLRDAMESMSDEGLQSLQKFVKLNDAGEIVGYQSVPDTKMWHHIKLGLDEFLNSAKAKNDQGRLNGRGRSILDAKRTIVKAMDDATTVPKAPTEYKQLRAPAVDGSSRSLVPLSGDGGSLVLPGPGAKWEEGGTESLYQKARGLWAGPSAEMSALEAGRDSMKGGKSYIDEVDTLWSGYSAAEKNAFRLGVISEIEQQVLLKDSHLNTAKKLALNPWYQDLLRMIAPSEKGYQRMMKRIELEDQMKETSNMVISGSQTANKQNDDAAQKVGVVIMDSLLGGLRGGINATRRVAGSFTDDGGKVRDHVMDLVADPTLGKFGKADEIRRSGERVGALSGVVGTAPGEARISRGAISAYVDEEQQSP